MDDRSKFKNSTNPTSQAVVNNFHRMLNRFMTELFHLHPTGRAIGDADIRRGCVQFGNHVGSDLLAQIKMISAQSPAANHPAAVAFQILKGNAL